MMTRRLLALCWFVAVWAVLWESASILVLVGGVVLGVGLLRAYPLTLQAGDDPRVFRPLAFLRFVAVCVVELFRANIAVTKAVFTPDDRLAGEGVVAVALVSDDELSVTLLSFIVSLTPGTLILEVDRDPAILYVHFLQIPSITAVRLDIARLEAVLLAAIAPDAVAAAARERVRSLSETLAEGTAP